MTMGKDWITFMKRSNLEVAGVLFQRKNNHTFTWTSPDVRDYKGVDVVSDHALVIRVFSVKLLKTRMQLAS